MARDIKSNVWQHSAQHLETRIARMRRFLAARQPATGSAGAPASGGDVAAAAPAPAAVAAPAPAAAAVASSSASEPCAAGAPVGRRKRAREATGPAEEPGAPSHAATAAAAAGGAAASGAQPKGRKLQRA